MGRVVKREIVGFRCELRSCTAFVSATVPHPVGASIVEQLHDLGALVAAGWGLVLTTQLRAYCPEHIDRVWACTCKTHPNRKHLCVEHDELTTGQVWTADRVPEEVSDLLEVVA